MKELLWLCPETNFKKATGGQYGGKCFAWSSLLTNEGKIIWVKLTGRWTFCLCLSERSFPVTLPNTLIFICSYTHQLVFHVSDWTLTETEVFWIQQTVISHPLWCLTDITQDQSGGQSDKQTKLTAATLTGLKIFNCHTYLTTHTDSFSRWFLWNSLILPLKWMSTLYSKLILL